MNKLVLDSNNSDKKIISFLIDKDIKLKLKEALTISEKYNLKKKSDWVNEAIEMLKNNPAYKEIVCNTEGVIGTLVFDKIYMTFKQRCLFAELKNDVVREYPDIKGPQAAIIRAAIFCRLSRKL